MWQVRRRQPRLGRMSATALGAAVFVAVAWLGWPGSTPTAFGQSPVIPGPLLPHVGPTGQGSTNDPSPAPLVLVGNRDPVTGQVQGALLGQGTGPINPAGATQPGASSSPQNVSSTTPDRMLPRSMFMP
jgi:hypothetical protein